MQAYRKLSQILTLHGAHQKDGRHLKEDDLSLIKNAAIVFDDKEILWIGPDEEFPKKFEKISQKHLPHHVLTPEIVDSHTHLVFGGDRSEEYAMRLNGYTYEQIAAKGGGILSTMKMTNETPTEKLFELACARLERIHSFGVGTIEIKSGYGLNPEMEYKLSKIIHRLKMKYKPGIQIKNTYMAAHAIPKDYSSSHAYMKEVVIPTLHKLHEEKLIDAVDIFHEQNYFDEEDVRLLFSEAKNLGLPCKSHADELNCNKGAQLAVEFEALSTDHLLLANDEGIKKLAQSKTVATLLPGTAFFLGKPQANARKFLDQGVKVAIASDYNPGSCHFDNLLLIASIAAPQYKINQTELWAGITLNAAHALGLHNQGALIPGLRPRFSLFQVDSLDQITYHWGKNFSVAL